MISSQKCLFNTTGLFRSGSLSLFLLLHVLKYWCVSVYTISVWDIWLRRINKQDVYCLQNGAVLFKKNKNKNGWGNTRCDLGPSLLLSFRALSRHAFVCHLLEETCSAADFTPSPSVLLSLNTSPWLWFITTLLLSPNPPVMLPVLTRPEIDDLSPRSSL